MKNAAARIRIVQTSTDSFKIRPPCAERTFRMRKAALFMLLDSVGAAAITTGGLTPSFPKAGSSDGVRMK